MATKKVEKRIVTSEEQIADLFHVVQEHMRGACGPKAGPEFFEAQSETKIRGPLNKFFYR